MKCKHTFTLSFLLISLIFSFLISGCRKDSKSGYSFHPEFITEEYKPLNYTENGVITGLGPELLKEICRELYIPFNTEILPWEQGYSQVLSHENAVLYSTVLNAERKDLFKWAGPYASLEWQFYASSGNPLELSSMDDARTVAGIGVLPDYSITQYLVSEGFTNLVYCQDNQEAFQKLLNGELVLFPSDRITAEAALQAIGKSIYEVTGKLTIRTDLVYFAFNKAVPDQVVNDFQRIIDKTKQNGFLRQLYQQYMQSANPPEIIQVYTEQYPPLTYRNSFGEITGFGTDLAREIMKRNQTYYTINLSHWSNGYEMALNNPNFCLFTMDRTELRENLFQWVGPLGSNITYFYVPATSSITITSLDEARALSSVGTVSSWFSDQYLRDQGFTNLISDSDPAVMTEKLMSGHVDCFVCTSVTFPSILRSLGYQYSQVKPAFALMSSDYYIAFSKTTSATIVNQWQQALDAVKQDGTYEAVAAKWFN